MSSPFVFNIHADKISSSGPSSWVCAFLTFLIGLDNKSNNNNNNKQWLRFRGSGSQTRRSHWTAAAVGRKHETLFAIGWQCRWCAPRRRDNGSGVGGDGATWSDDGRSQPLCIRHSAQTPRLSPPYHDTTNKPSGATGLHWFLHYNM